MRQIAEFVAVLSCGLFAGAAVYVSLVEHPARMGCGVELAATEFPPSYRRGTILQVTLAVVCLLSSIAAWLAGATLCWVVAGVLQVSVIPFTLVVILPTNKQLLSPHWNKRSAQAGQLLVRWGRLHAVEKRARRIGAATILVLGNLRKAVLTVGEVLRVRNLRHPRPHVGLSCASSCRLDPLYFHRWSPI